MDTLQATDTIEDGKVSLEHNGCLLHRGVFSMEQVTILRERLEEQADMERERGVATFAFEENNISPGANYMKQLIGKPESDPPFQRVQLLVNKGRCFIEAAANPVINAYLEHAFRGYPYHVSNQTGVILRRGAAAQPVHIDQSAVPFTTPIPMFLTVSIALGEHRAEMGATCFVPGSHRFDAPADGLSIDEVESVGKIVMEPGSIAIWDSRLWHCQGACASDQPRMSIALFYSLHFMKQVDCYPTAIHDDVYQQMSDQERVLFGFKMESSAGRIGPRGPLDTRRNVGESTPYIPLLSAGDEGRSVAGYTPLR